MYLLNTNTYEQLLCCQKMSMLVRHEVCASLRMVSTMQPEWVHHFFFFFFFLSPLNYDSTVDYSDLSHWLALGTVLYHTSYVDFLFTVNFNGFEP